MPQPRRNGRGLGFEGVEATATGRPACHPSTMRKIYLYGYLNRIQWRCRLEQDARCNLELMWLVGGLAPEIARTSVSGVLVTGLILPVGVGVMLWVALRRPDLLGGYHYPRGLAALGVAAWLLTIYLGWRSLGSLARLFG
jgi:hypothetical protein